MDNSIEYIICAAIWYKELKISEDGSKFQPKNVDRGIVVCGWRHGNCIMTVKELSGLRSVKISPDGVGENVQGFLTNKNIFVDRHEAARIAFDAKQIDKPTKTLFSEDIY